MKKLDLYINFKAYLTPQEIESYFKDVSLTLKNLSEENISVTFLLPFTELYQTRQFIKKQGFKNVFLGAQNVSVFSPGAFTGEITAAQIFPTTDFCLVNHSERRKYFNEDTKMAIQKIENLLELGIKPIVCVSDPEMLLPFFDYISKIEIAYEPLESVGTSNFLGTKNIENFYTKSNLQKNLIYGGSVDASCVLDIAGLNFISGFLISSYCTNSSNFVNLIELLTKK